MFFNFVSCLFFSVSLLAVTGCSTVAIRPAESGLKKRFCQPDRIGRLDISTGKTCTAEEAYSPFLASPSIMKTCKELGVGGINPKTGRSCTFDDVHGSSFSRPTMPSRKTCKELDVGKLNSTTGSLCTFNDVHALPSIP